MWLPEAIRLKTIKIYLPESSERYRRRRHEPSGVVGFMERITQRQPNYRMYRCLRTLQGLDYVYCLRGIKKISFWDYTTKYHIRDTTFQLDVETTVKQPKTADDDQRSQVRNLAPLLANYDPPNILWQVMYTCLPKPGNREDRAGEVGDLRGWDPSNASNSSSEEDSSSGDAEDHTGQHGAGVTRGCQSRSTSLVPSQGNDSLSMMDRSKSGGVEHAAGAVDNVSYNESETQAIEDVNLGLVIDLTSDDDHDGSVAAECTGSTSDARSAETGPAFMPTSEHSSMSPNRETSISSEQSAIANEASPTLLVSDSEFTNDGNLFSRSPTEAREQSALKNEASPSLFVSDIGFVDLTVEDGMLFSPSPTEARGAN